MSSQDRRKTISTLLLQELAPTTNYVYKTRSQMEYMGDATPTNSNSSPHVTACRNKASRSFMDNATCSVWRTNRERGPLLLNLCVCLEYEALPTQYPVGMHPTEAPTARYYGYPLLRISWTGEPFRLHARSACVCDDVHQHPLQIT